MPKPTILNARKSVIGNLVFLSGELNINEYAVQNPDDGIDFSDHVSRILDFDFITGSTPNLIEQVQVHAVLKNQSNEQILNFMTAQSNISESDGNQRGVLGFSGTYTDSSTPLKVDIINGGSGYSDGTHAGQVLTGRDSGANNGRATVIVSSGIVTSVQITTVGSNYHDMEKINVAAPGGSGAEIVGYQSSMSSSNTPFAAQFFPILTGDTTIKIVNFYSNKGDGGVLNDTNESTPRRCEFTLIGKR